LIFGSYSYRSRPVASFESPDEIEAAEEILRMMREPSLRIKEDPILTKKEAASKLARLRWRRAIDKVKAQNRARSSITEMWTRYGP
jgi:hypothetical protein